MIPGGNRDLEWIGWLSDILFALTAILLYVFVGLALWEGVWWLTRLISWIKGFPT